MWTIGVADRLCFPRFPSYLGKQGNARLRPHPHRLPRHHEQQCIDEVNDRFVEPVAPVTVIGADIETGRVTP
jgi:hypothetical protein